MLVDCYLAGKGIRVKNRKLTQGITMVKYSICGIDCDICKFKTEQSGKCSQFPCDKLKEWASNENPERIDNLRKL